MMVASQTRKSAMALAAPLWLLVWFLYSCLFGHVSGQGCSNTCPPVNFGTVVPALCEGDRLDDPTNIVKADVMKNYSVCYPTAATTPQSFKFEDFRGPNRVTVVANYYTGCNAGRRESGVFAHVAQRYYDQYGPDRTTFIQSVKGGGTCSQWAGIYQSDAQSLFPDSGVVPQEYPLSLLDQENVIRDELFTTPFGHPAYVIFDGNLQIRNKFIGPCCGHESYFDCTADIAKSLEQQLTQYIDAILSEQDQTNGTGMMEQTTSPQEEPVPEDDTSVTSEGSCEIGEWSEWSSCSVRCGSTPGIEFRWRTIPSDTSTCEDTVVDAIPVEIRPCSAPEPNCNVLDGGSPACIPEFGESWAIETVVEGLNSPRDVAFHPTPGYHLGNYSEGRVFYPNDGEEAWVLNGNNHSVSIVASLGTEYQTTISRTDRGYYHYLANGTALSFNMVANSGRSPDRDSFNYWAICNDNLNTYLDTKEPNYFMGPTLYDTNPRNRNLVNRLGQVCQPEEQPCYFLHSDMLHEAPACIGIVHDPETVTAFGTVYWAFDTTGNRETGQLVRFDFQQPHGPGSMDHSVASVRRYVEVELTRGESGVHAGMVVHADRRELFVAVPGANKILRVNTDSGSFARTAREEYPIYSNQLPSFEYSIFECVEQSDFVTGIDTPSGMALSPDGERIFVAERGTGNIVAYEVATGATLYSVSTPFNTIGGMKFSPVGEDLYFVDDETNTLNVLRANASCSIVYAPRIDPTFTVAVESARSVLGDTFSLSLNYYNCTVDPTIPDSAFFDQVHDDTGYADENPDVQSEMAGMDAAAALLANRTDCEYDSELNFDALLLGGYFCHQCLPDQDKTCDLGGTCTNVQWEGYFCDNEYYILKDPENSNVDSMYIITTANGTVVDTNDIVLKAGMMYRFTVMVDEEVCLSTSLTSPSRAESSIYDLDSGPDRSSSLSRQAIVLGCATSGPLLLDMSSNGMAGSQLFINVLGQPIFQVNMEQVPSENNKGGLSAGAIAGIVVGVAFGLLIGCYGVYKLSKPASYEGNDLPPPEKEEEQVNAAQDGHA